MTFIRPSDERVTVPHDLHWLMARSVNVRPYVRRGHPVRGYTRDVYVSKDDIEWSAGWAGEGNWVHKQSREVMRGTPIGKADLPDVLWHVSTNVNAVLRSGKLKWMGDTGTGGLGGGSSMTHRAISLTHDRNDAIIIQRELLRAGEVARGGTPIRRLLDRYGREDSKFYHKDLTGAVPHAFSVYGKMKDTPGNRFDLFRAYLRQRETAGGPEDPVLFGSAKDFLHVRPSNTGIFAVRRQDVPERALIMRYPIGDKALHEIKIYADLPVHGTHVIRRSAYRRNPLRLTARTQ